MKQLLYLIFFFGVSLDTFSQCSPTISILGSSFSESPPTFPTNRIGLDYEISDLLINRPGFITISIGNSNGCSSWQVLVERVDITRNTNLSFWVRKTNDGSSFTSGSSISPIGLTDFQEITLSSQSFMSGVKDRQSIQINYKISGISLLRKTSTYLSNITFSVTGTP
jgi:hypothetical protein